MGFYSIDSYDPLMSGTDGVTNAGGGGGGGAATGSYVSLDSHKTQPGNYTLNVGPGNSGAAIIFQSI